MKCLSINLSEFFPLSCELFQSVIYETAKLSELNGNINEQTSSLFSFLCLPFSLQWKVVVIIQNLYN